MKHTKNQAKTEKTVQTPSKKGAISVNFRALALLFFHYPKVIVSRLICVAWTALTPYVGIYFSARVIEALTGARDPQTLWRLVLATLLAAAVVSIVSALLVRWRDNSSSGMYGAYYLVEQLFAEKLLDMDFAAVDDTKTHELLSEIRQSQNSAGWGLFRVVSDVETLVSSLFSLLGGITLTVSLFTARVPESAGGYTVLNHPLFALAVVALLLGVTCLSPLLSNKADSFWARNVGNHNLANRLYGHFGWLGHRKELATDVRIYRQDLLCDKHTHNKEDTFGSAGPFARYARGPMGLYGAASAAVSVVFSGAVYLFVCLKAWAGAFGIGMVTQYIAAITKVAGGVSSLVSAAGSMKNNAAFLRQVFDYFDIPNDMCRGCLPLPQKQNGGYEVEFRDVSFRYPGTEKDTLHDINLVLHPGEKLAVVGQNGSGKTTFIKLLCRLYDPTEGVILLNGKDIREYRYEEYMKVFSVVFQDFRLFALPLGENVAAGMAYDSARVTDCLQKAGFGERLAKLPEGPATWLYKDLCKEGVDVSGGEAQKIAIARALYKNAPFLILDEPTAALDPLAEAEIYEKLSDIVEERTAVYISHRLSSCKFCDEILVFDGGAVVQKGTHAQLLADERGKYSELWHAQAQYYAH